MMDNMVCYCFNFTEADIKKDLIVNGKSTILENILKEKQKGDCQCNEKIQKGSDV